MGSTQHSFVSRVASVVIGIGLLAACSGSDGAASTTPATEPTADTAPAVTDPPATAIDPPATGPSVTDAVAADPPVTDPPATDPPPTDPQVVTEPPQSGSFSALTYNVAGLPDALSGSNPAVNTALIGPLMNQYDLVLIQETWLVPDESTYHQILVETSTLPNQSEPAINPENTDELRPSAILSDGLNRFSIFDFEPVARERWTNCGDDAADCLAVKGFSMSRTTLDSGVSVDIYNLHAEAGNDDTELRGENVAQLAAYIEANSQGNAVIVGGDFNLHIDEEPDATQFAELLSLAGLTDVCTELECAEPFRIDKFVYRSAPGLTISPTSWTNADPVFTRDDGEPLSDHDPVVVEFAWTAE